MVAIALPDCINPSLIGGQLFVATRPRARRGVVTFALAAWSVTFLIGVALGLGLADLILSLVPKPGASVKYALVTAAGIVMIVGAAVIWIRRNALTGAEPIDERRRYGSPALIGAALAGVEMLTAFPYFAAIALIAGSGVSNAEKLLLLILYCVIYTLPLIGIAVTVAVMGARAERVLRPIGTLLVTHWPIIVAPTTAVIGIAVLAFGIVQLGSI
ncbi:MAG TPA: GAP family protein [Solirubrobacteraceae bacterium]|nr:GAP family protein [Solirubrobacteraceae bacterium]